MEHVACLQSDPFTGIYPVLMVVPKNSPKAGTSEKEETPAANPQ